MRTVQRITGIEGVANSGTARIKFQVGRRYHQLLLATTVAGAATLASTVVDRVRLFVNGITIRDLTAAQILLIAASNGMSVTNGILPINFSEPWRADKIDEQLTAWDMFGETTFEMEVTFKNPGGGAVGLTGYMIFDGGRTLINNQPSKNIVKQFTVSKNSLLGFNDFDNIPTRDPIQRIMLVSATGTEEVEVQADGSKVHESNIFSNTNLLAQHGLVSTTTNYLVAFDFTERIDDALVARTMNVRYKAAAAELIEALVEARSPGFF